MKSITTALLLCSTLLSTCLAKPSKRNLIGGNVVQHHEPLSLDVNGEYSQADLQKLFAVQAEVRRGHLKVESTVLQTQEPEISKASGELENSKAWKQVDLSGAADITYWAECRNSLFVAGNFTVDVKFNGKVAHWTKIQNIDDFGYISISGHGNPYTSRADYHHSVCKAPNSRTICTYYHFGIFTADIHIRDEPPYIRIGAVMPDTKLSKYRQPYVIQTCRPVPKGVAKVPCPHLDPTVPENWCKLGKIHVTQH